MRKISFVVVIFSIIFYKSSVLSQEEVREVIVSGEKVVTDITQEEAYNAALENAWNKAVEQACGVKVQAVTLLIDNLFEGNFIDILRGGYVVWDSTLAIEQIPFQESLTSLPTNKLIIKLKAKVICRKEEPDPGFSVKLKLYEIGWNALTDRTLEKEVIQFKNTTEIAMEVIPSQDCYITVLNIAEDHQVTVLFPNYEYYPDNFVKANTKFWIPPDELWQALPFTVMVPEGKSHTKEAIRVIATKRKIDFIGSHETSEEIINYKGLTIIQTESRSLSKLYKWLAKIPLNELATDMKIIKIVR